MFHDLKLLGTEAALNFEIHLDKDKRFYCLYGRNGVGKTNFLQNLARTMLGTHSMLQLNPGPYKFGGIFSQKEIHSALSNNTLNLPMEIDVAGVAIKNNSQHKWRFASLQTLAGGVLHHFDSPVANSWIVDKPVVLIGTSGRGHTTNIAKGALTFVGSSKEEFIRAYERTWHAATGDPRPIEGIASWIASRLLINPAFVEGSTIRAAEVVALCELLAELDPIFKDYIVREPSGMTRVAIRFHDGALWFGPTPIDKLATGYIAVIKIFQEIISAYSAWAGMINADNIRTVDGIVLIDEVEAHLHPRWQVNLVGLLKKAFPNTTFIVCTHSPLIVAQTDIGEAYELVRTDNRVVSQRLGSPRDWYLADVYSHAFHLEIPIPGSIGTDDEIPLNDQMVDFSTHVKDFLAKREEATRTAALALYERLLARLSEDDPRRRSLDSLRSLLG